MAKFIMYQCHSEYKPTSLMLTIEQLISNEMGDSKKMLDEICRASV